MDPEEKRQDDTPMIELHKVDAIMAHAGKIVRDVKIVVAIFAAIIIAIVYIFVSKYNARTNDWLKTFEYVLNRTTATEVSNGNTEEIQQLSPP